MNTISIRSYNHETRIYTPEEYVRFRLIDSPSHAKYRRIFVKNAGVTKETMKDLAMSKYSINDIKGKTTKEEILDKILKKEDIFELAKMFNIGVKWYQYGESFGLSKEQVEMLADIGFLILLDTEINNYLQEEGVYDIKQFNDMTQEKINEVTEKYKIYKKENDTCFENINSAFEFNKEMKNEMNNLEDKFKDIEEFADDPEGFIERHGKQKTCK